MSTYSPSLRIELITTGDQAGVWGNTTNTNLGTLVESAIAGYVSVSITSANQALTALNGAADESRNMSIALTTTTTAPFNVYAPPAEKTYIIYNASAYAATIFNSSVLGNTTAAGTGVIIPAGKTVTVWSDGTNFRTQNDHLNSLTLSTDLAVADGGTGASTAAGARTNLGVTATGADTTYAFRANNLSDLASASAARTNLGLGTMATQNANSVAITGGSVTGITDLAIADGGTGASDAAGARANLGVPSVGGSGASGIWNIDITGIAANATIAAIASSITANAIAQIYPVGSIYTNATNGTNPASLFGFGTWVAFGAGRVPVGFNAGDARFNSPEETGGSYDAVLPSHTHSWSGSSSGSTGNTNLNHVHTATLPVTGTTSDQSNGHSHGYSGNTDTHGGHAHGLFASASQNPGGLPEAPYNGSGVGTFYPNDTTGFAGEHSHSFSGSTGGTSVGHTHTIASGFASGNTGGADVSLTHNHSVTVSTSGSNSSTGVDPTSGNIQPYITVYMWKRVA